MRGHGSSGWLLPLRLRPRLDRKIGEGEEIIRCGNRHHVGNADAIGRFGLKRKNDAFRPREEFGRGIDDRFRVR